MPMMRSLTAGLGLLALVAGASAQLDGPAPLAWRWLQPTSVSPTAPPVVDADRVFYSLGSRVFSLDLTTGNLRWRFPSVDPIEGVFRSAPVLIDGTLVVAGDNKIVYGVDPNTGSLKWTFNTPGRVLGQPVAVGKYFVLAQSDNKILAIDATTGQDFWSDAPLQIYDGITGTMGVNGNDILVFGGQTLYSINLATKKTTWKLPFQQLAPTVAPLVAAGSIFVNSGSTLVALNPVSGRARWQKDPRIGDLAYAPAVNEGTVLVVSRDGFAAAYDLNGQPINTRPINLGSLPVARPTGVGSKFVVPTSNGAVNLVDPRYVPPTPAGGSKTTEADPRYQTIRPGAKIDAPSEDLLWSFVIRPMPGATQQSSTTGNTGGGFPGGGGGFPGGGGGAGGVGGAGGGFGGGGQTNNQDTTPISIQAAAPAVLAGQTLLVAAKDGSLLAFDRTLGIDLTAPTVTMAWPSSGDQVSGQPPLELIFKIEDEATGIDVRSLKITIDEKPVEFSFSREGYAIVNISTTGKNRPLTDGRKNIVVEVADWMGNLNRSNFSLLIDNSLRPLVRPNSNTNNPGRPGGGPGGGPGRGGGGGGGGFGGGDGN